jgi:hypothetical protein
MADPKLLVKENIAFLFVLGIIALLVFASIPDPVPAMLKPDVDASTKQSVDTLIEVNKYLISIAFVVIAVLGGAVISDKGSVIQKNFLLIILFFASNLLAIVSLVYGYLLYNEIIDVFSNQISSVTTERISYFRQKQFISLIVSVVAFSGYIFNLYFKKIN